MRFVPWHETARRTSPGHRWSRRHLEAMDLVSGRGSDPWRSIAKARARMGTIAPGVWAAFDAAQEDTVPFDVSLPNDASR